MERTIRMIISIAISVLVAYLAISFIIWLLPVLLIAWLAYFIFKKLNVVATNVKEGPKKTNVRKVNGKVIIDAKKRKDDIYE